MPGRLMMIRGAILFAGAIGVSLVDRLNQNLYEVVLALGVAYLIPGIISGHRRWAESGVLLTTMGAAIVSTDLFVAAATYVYALVFGSIALALLILQTFSVGRVAGVGRSLITVGLALWVLATLPDILPLGGAWAGVDALFPLLPGTSGLVLLIRGWVRYEREAARSARVDP